MFHYLCLTLDNTEIGKIYTGTPEKILVYSKVD